ncbi:hypothetical protein IPZ58_29490 [Streptomyces roseoverticillatus]|uniref:hypothetical protein n=1 Tax=Streptomyces roseoverticillatus TaxID=66429 RepID=UPI001F1C4288|nr:hypothetical protein [Streptomyces roseoverticillatus]MCF3105699.1 hypothetical protein [Streptomyces roseoverticillatus]
MISDAYDYFIELRDGHTSERPAALWRSVRDRGVWQFWSTADWSWRPVGDRHRVSAPPGLDTLRAVDSRRAAELQAHRQLWAEYWAEFEDGPDGRRIARSVIRRRCSPEETRCEFSNGNKFWMITLILSEGDDAVGQWERVSVGEADAVLEVLKGRPGATDLGRSGLNDARPGGPFRYYAALDSKGGTTGLWRREGDQWEFFSALEWGWFPESYKYARVYFIGTLRQEGELPAHPEELKLQEIDDERARELEADREAWIRGYWLYWHSSTDWEAGERPRAIIRKVSGARTWRDEHFPGHNDRWIDTDAVMRFPDYRSSDYPWLEKTDRAGAVRFLEEEYGLTGVVEH